MCSKLKRNAALSIVTVHELQFVSVTCEPKRGAEIANREYKS